MGATQHFFLNDPEFPGAVVDPYGINDKGQIVGEVIDNRGAQAVLDTGGTFTLFDFLPGQETSRNYFYGINDSGQIVGGYFPDDDFVAQGFVVGPPYPSALNCLSDYPPQDCLEHPPNGINNAGLIVGQLGAFSFSGYVYVGGNYIPINDPNAGTMTDEGTVALGINNSDQIVGFYTDANHVTHGFLATPTAPLVPEPRTLPVLFVCLLAVAVTLRRKVKSVRQD